MQLCFVQKLLSFTFRLCCASRFDAQCFSHVCFMSRFSFSGSVSRFRFKWRFTLFQSTPKVDRTSATYDTGWAPLLKHKDTVGSFRSKTRQDHFRFAVHVSCFQLVECPPLHDVRLMFPWHSHSILFAQRFPPLFCSYSELGDQATCFDLPESKFEKAKGKWDTSS